MDTVGAFGDKFRAGTAFLAPIRVIFDAIDGDGEVGYEYRNEK